MITIEMRLNEDLFNIEKIYKAYGTRPVIIKDKIHVFIIPTSQLINFYLVIDRNKKVNIKIEDLVVNNQSLPNILELPYGIRSSRFSLKVLFTYLSKLNLSPFDYYLVKIVK